MNTITKIIFQVYSKNNPKRYQHIIYAEGTLNFKEIGDRQYEWIQSRGSIAALKFEETKIEYYHLHDSFYLFFTL